MQSVRRFMVLIVALMALGASEAFASGGAPIRRDAGQQAADAYNLGVRELSDAKKYDSDAAVAIQGEKQAKALGRAQKAYRQALDQFQKAVNAKPELFQAWNYIGFTQRHLGDYESALTAYARALELNPTYEEAVEYRAEAYLGLNRIEDAKSAYMELFGAARPLADELLQSMRRWIAERQTDPRGVRSDELAVFAQWVESRASIAQQTVSFAVGTPPRPMRDWN
jgi:tetratricopeptide (TPR) repeat protein